MDKKARRMRGAESFLEVYYNSTGKKLTDLLPFSVFFMEDMRRQLYGYPYTFIQLCHNLLC